MLDIEIAILVLFVFSPIIAALLYEFSRGLQHVWRRQKK